MSLYVMLSKMTGFTKRHVRSKPDFIADSARQVSGTDNRILTTYAVLGRYDLISIAEANDNESAAKLSLELSLITGLKIETVPALQVGQLHDKDRRPDEDDITSATIPHPATGNEIREPIAQAT